MKYSENDIKNKLAQFNIKLIGRFEFVNKKTELQCFCDNIFFCRPACIFRGTTKSCGCYNRKITSERCLINLTGKKFGKLLVIELLPEPKKYRKYKCLCDCGKTKNISANHLRSGNTKSCGCYQKQSRIGKNHSRYNHNLTDEERKNNRQFNPNNRKWTKQIFKRDNYTCQICYRKGIRLNAHHLDGYNWCYERRFDVTNGITLCKRCHINFHKKYGYKNNTKEQFLEAIS